MSTYSFDLDLALGLLAGHLVGDFIVQTAHLATHKRRLIFLLWHSVQLAALSYVFVGRWSAPAVPLAIFVTHAIIDYIKARWARRNATSFVVDQAAHLAVIAALAVGLPSNTALSFWTQQFGHKVWVAWIIVSGAIIAIRGGAFLVGYWVQPYLDEIEKNPDAALRSRASTRGLTNGGRVIGQWERALIFLFVGLGQPASIGFLVAAKSIFRFGELKERDNRMEAEYITIGTLMSFGWALATAYTTWWLARAVQ